MKLPKTSRAWYIFPWNGHRCSSCLRVLITYDWRDVRWPPETKPRLLAHSLITSTMIDCLRNDTWININMYDVRNARLFFWRRQVHSHWRQIWVTCGYQYDLRDRQIQSEHFRIVRLSLQTKIRREEEEKQPNEREEQAVWGRKALLRPERPYSLKHRSISS